MLVNDFRRELLRTGRAARHASGTPSRVRAEAPAVDTSTIAARYRPRARREGTALCLSGGGFRAALFHAGAIRRLNELGVLSEVRTVCSVSGGSIASGLLATVWPRLERDGKRFTNLQALFEQPLRAFCGRNIRNRPLLWGRLDPRNWPRLASPTFSATDLLAAEYERLLGSVRLRDLPEHPRFVFCAANLQTGVSFELTSQFIGDYVLGYSEPGGFTVAEAVAASSSFPFAFPPLVRAVDVQSFTGGDARAVASGFRPGPRIALTDGGVYDNMGLEPAWKSHAVVLVSDGGTPFEIKSRIRTWLVPRLQRSFQVVANQALAVRKRWLIAAYLREVYGGTYWGLGTDRDEYQVPGAERPAGYSGRVLDRLRLVRTDLDRFSPAEQSVLMNHGWALAGAAVSRWSSALISQAAPPQPPDPTLLDPDAALAALAESDRFRFLGH
jgi:NTE family protein